jgi:hypothetical protein
MAQINEQKITFKLSKLIRDNETATSVLTDDMLAALFEAIQEMA